MEEELAEVVHRSLDELQRLADDIQEASRLERGTRAPASGRCELAAAVEMAREALRPAITLEGPAGACVEGPWEESRLARALAGFAENANRMGEGRGTVHVEAGVDNGQGHITLHERFGSGRARAGRRGGWFRLVPIATVRAGAGGRGRFRT